MNDWIKLHVRNSEKEIIINTRQIQYITADDFDNTHIYLVGSTNEYIVVKETVKETFEIIRGNRA